MYVKISSCPIPLVWLDTNVIIDITKYKENKYLNELQIERISKLNEIIYKKTREGKLLFVEGDQREEINSLIKEAHSTQSFLSMGIKFKYRKAIHDNQLYEIMKAYVNKQDDVVLKYEDAFYRDPIKELEERNKGHLKGLIISVFRDVNQDQLIERMKQKEKITSQFEVLRQKLLAEGVTFEQQLQTEYTGLIQALNFVTQNMNYKIKNNLDISYEDFNQFSIVTELMNIWESLSINTEGLIDFLLSDYYKAIPYVDIRCRLLAKIITSKSTIESGDSMDVEHLSTVIPYCNYVVTDRKMRNRIVDLGIDQEYNTKVYCLKDTIDLIAELESL